MHIFRDSFSDEDIAALAKSLLEQALAGDMKAAQLLLDKLLPDTCEAELEQRLDEIERLLREGEK